jgi:hypothetical protein
MGFDMHISLLPFNALTIFPVTHIDWSESANNSRCCGLGEYFNWYTKLTAKDISGQV